MVQADMYFAEPIQTASNKCKPMQNFDLTSCIFLNFFSQHMQSDERDPHGDIQGKSGEYEWGGAHIVRWCSVVLLPAHANSRVLSSLLYLEWGVKNGGG